MGERSAKTGIVVIGRNEGERLERCLLSLREYGGPVIYVDSNSTDGSPATAAKLGAEVIELDPRFPFTAARARSDGFCRLQEIAPQLAYVFFVDGDCQVEKGFLDAAEQFLEGDSTFAVVCGRRRERFPDRSVYNALIDSEWNTDIGETLSCGGDAVFRLDAYQQAGGFDPAMLAGEEPELCSRLRHCGWRIMRLDQPMTIHDAAMYRFSQWWRRAVRSGMGYAQAWRSTINRRHNGLYQRELLRAVFWAGALPLFAVLLAVIIKPAWLILWPLATLLQFLRLWATGFAFSAFLAVVGKYAELFGVGRFLLRRRPGSTVHYK